MKKILLFFMFITVLLTITACNDPVFYFVSTEPPRLNPRIGGSPSNFAVLNNRMYVASGRNLFYYENDNWGRIPFNSWIGDISATDSFLSVSSENGILFRINAAGEISQINTSLNLQTIFGTGNVLYISSFDSNNIYSVHYLLDGADTPSIVDTGTAVSMLNGLAVSGSTVFLSSNHGRGVFETTAGSSSAVRVTGSEKDFTGIISLDDGTVVGITRTGMLYQISPGPISAITSIGRNSNDKGALAVWRDPSEPSIVLLLAGTQDVSTSFTSSDTHGYMELELSASGALVDGHTFRWPGQSPPYSTVDSYSRYVSSIGKHAVNYIFQAPSTVDPKMTLFASTQQRGVWAYRQRGALFQWNAEE
jgi:hypothetical protein